MVTTWWPLVTDGSNSANSYSNFRILQIVMENLGSGDQTEFVFDVDDCSTSVC